MRISAKQALEAFQESFIQQNSSPIAELLSDDFVCISSKNETQTKEEMLEWVGSFKTSYPFEHFFFCLSFIFTTYTNKIIR